MYFLLSFQVFAFPCVINLWIFVQCSYRLSGAEGNLKLIFTPGNWATIGHWFMNRQWRMIPRNLVLIGQSRPTLQYKHKTWKYRSTNSCTVLQIQIQSSVHKYNSTQRANADWSNSAPCPMSWLNVAKSINQQSMQTHPEPWRSHHHSHG